jgi:hypothetical protein
MTPTCINLRERFRQQYRTGFDQAAENRNDPWMMTIPCRWGTIYPHGAEMLALELDCHPKVAKQVAAILGIVLHQDGNEEKTFLFPVGLFDQVVALVEPKRVRRLSEEHKAKLLEAGQKHWFKDGSGDSSGERQALRTTAGDQEVA